MFDIGFSELLLIGVVALVVLGPERLPKVARTAGHLFGRLQRYVATVKADLNREMEMSELAKVKQEVQDAARAFEQSAQEQTKEFESQARAVSDGVQTQTNSPATAATASSSQANMLLAQEQEMSTPVASTPSTDSASLVQHPDTDKPTPPTPVKISTAPIAVQGTLDLGIEPVRIARS